MISMAIGGDLLPTENNQKYFTDGSMQELIGKNAYSLFASSDFGLFNLEGPLTSSSDSILKIGPCIKGEVSSVNGLSKLGGKVIASISNNHILDYGGDGLKETMSCLQKNGILFVGAGMGLKEAKEPIILEKNGIKIGVLSFAESEFTIARECSPGANPYDPLTSFDDIEILKAKVNYLIVLYHGGVEFFQYPAPYLRRICRKMADKGADIILCQHSHCIGVKEYYNESLILYGQGNFVLCMNDGYMDPVLSSHGLLLKVRFESGCKPFVDFIPIVRNDNQVRIPQQELKEKIITDFENRSELAEDEQWVKEQYNCFISGKIDQYIATVQGYSARILKMFHVNPIRMYRKLHFAALLNVIRCEAHRDAFIGGILNKLEEEN